MQYTTLPAPSYKMLDFMQQNSDDPTKIKAGAETIRENYLGNQPDEQTLIQQRIQAGKDAHKKFSNTIDGEFIADSYGDFKFRQIDKYGFVIPNEYYDSNLPQSDLGGYPEWFSSDQF